MPMFLSNVSRYFFRLWPSRLNDLINPSQNGQTRNRVGLLTLPFFGHSSLLTNSETELTIHENPHYSVDS